MNVRSPPCIGALAAATPNRAEPSTAKSWLKAIEITSGIEADPTRLLADVVDEWAARAPDRPAILSENGSLTYGALSDRINRYARWSLAAGVRPGEVIALLMPSRPDYLAAWLGITKVGGVVALINTNLVGASLTHCIYVAGACHIIVADELFENYERAAADLDGAPQLWLHGGADVGPRIDRWLDSGDGNALSTQERPCVTIDDLALLIYTSGTTGLPKAARVSHRRVMSWAGWFSGLTNAMPDDRMYNCLPIYHSVGGVVATGSMLIAGGSVVIATKFSATRFWDDIVRWDCTMFQYIGELCRYLLQAAPSNAETHHRLRLCCGNGLRGEIWEAFQARFSIPRILEFYASTEGNFSLYNVEGRPGAIGRIPPFLAHRFPATIVRFDVAADAPFRDAQGLCVPCQPGEVGEALGRIGAAKNGGGAFEGYTSDEDSAHKVLRDVLMPGDRWFRTGDLMMRDGRGFFHFVDRIGDGFRWKGENVATSEVAEALAMFRGVIDASVYGVAVPHTEGRAGMAALVVDDRFDLAALPAHLTAALPAYAHPVFIRLRGALEITETFKQKKQDLIREGFDVASVFDPLFVRDAALLTYRPLDPELHARVLVGNIRL